MFNDFINPLLKVPIFNSMNTNKKDAVVFFCGIFLYLRENEIVFLGD